MSKTFQAIAWFTIVSALSIMVLIGYWSLVPYTPLVIKTNPEVVLNENKTIKSGDFLSYAVNYCKNSKVVPIVSKAFVDGFVYVLPDNLATSKGVGCGEDIIQIYVPKALPTGYYSLKTTYRYKVNPVRDIDVYAETEKFTVTK